jgi:hypothetical protein
MWHSSENASQAIADVFKKPASYSFNCQEAQVLLLLRGTGQAAAAPRDLGGRSKSAWPNEFTEGLFKAAVRDAPLLAYVKGRITAKRQADDDADWVPGDVGVIWNRGLKGQPVSLTSGQCLMYVGGSRDVDVLMFSRSPRKFFGHTSGANRYRNLEEWIDEVNGWPPGNGKETNQAQVGITRESSLSPTSFGTTLF